MKNTMLFIFQVWQNFIYSIIDEYGQWVRCSDFGMDFNHHNRSICLASVIGKTGENKHLVLKIFKHVKLKHQVLIFVRQTSVLMH